MRQSGHYKGSRPLTSELVLERLQKKIESLNVKQAVADVASFLSDPASVEVWSKDFFSNVAGRIRFSDG